MVFVETATYRCKQCPRSVTFRVCTSCDPVWVMRYRKWSGNAKKCYCSRCVAESGYWEDAKEEAERAEKRNYACARCRHQAHESGHVPETRRDALQNEYCTAGAPAPAPGLSRELMKAKCEKCGIQAPWFESCNMGCNDTWKARAHGWARGSKERYWCKKCLCEDGYPPEDEAKAKKELCATCQGATMS